VAVLAVDAVLWKIQTETAPSI